MGNQPRFKVPPRPGAQPATSQTASSSPQPASLRRPPPPPLRKNSPHTPDAPDDSTKTLPSQGVDVRQVPHVADPLDPTPAPRESESKARETICSFLQYYWAKLVALLMAGSLKFILGRSDNRPYLLCRGIGNAYVIEINRQSSAMIDLLRRCVTSNRGEGPTRRHVEEAIEVLASYAQEYGERIDTFYRVAPHPDVGIVIDIGDPDRTQAWIKPGCVQMIQMGSGLPFLRPKTMWPLAMPADRGDIDRFNQYIPSDPPTALLFIAWVTYTIAHPKQDASKYLILVLLGGEGSGKTSLSKRLQRLVDPTAMGVQTFPRNVQDLAVALLTCPRL